MAVERSPELEALTRRFRRAFHSGDADGALSLISRDASVTFIGTDPDEVWTGYEGLEAIYRAHSREMLGVIEETIEELVGFESGTVGWVHLRTKAVLPRPGNFRQTTVWLLEGTQWRVIQLHASWAIDNEESLGIRLSAPLELIAEAVASERPQLGPATAPDGTVTLLFTDIEGSTRLNQSLGDRAWMDLLRRHHSLVRKQVSAYDGFEVKSMGVGFMIAFGSARRAIQCASAIQQAIDNDAELDIRVRAGVHAGEAVREGDDFYGSTVNMAARVASAAGGGEVLVSSLVKALVDTSGEFTFGVPRSVELKGIAGRHELSPIQFFDIGAECQGE